MSARTEPRRDTSLGLRATWLVVACLLPAIALAQIVGVSDPPSEFPILPPADDVTIEITDIETAPPIARASILQLVALGIYPITPQGEALPNELIDLATAAYMLVNAFAPEAAGQYPVPEDAALQVVAVLTASAATADTVLTVGEFLDVLLGTVRFKLDDTTALEAELMRRYPALEAGNPEAPLTRAGAALMVTIALEFLTSRPD